MENPSAVKPAVATSATTTSTLDNLSGKIGRYRWKICALLFFATTLNYVDRQVLGLLKPVLQNPVTGIGLTEISYGYIVMAFSLAYAVCNMSLRQVAAWAEGHDLAAMSNVAVLKRLRGAAP